MKNVLILLITFLSINTLAVYGQASPSRAEEIIRQNALRKVMEWEINESLRHMSYPGLDPALFSTSEKRRLAGGEKVENRNPLFPIVSDIFPLVKLRQASTIDFYKNIDGQVKKISSQSEFGAPKTTIAISIISVYVPWLLAFFIPIAGFERNKIIKRRITSFIILANLFVLTSIILGYLVSGFTDNSYLFGLFIMILLALTFLSDWLTSEKIIAISGLIAGTFAGVYVGRLSILGFSLVSKEFGLIWIYTGIYILSSLISLVAMWFTKTADSWKDVIFAVSDNDDL